MQQRLQPSMNLITAGHVDHGKTSLVQVLTGKWADQHSEELKRGITIRLGYATCVIMECPKSKGTEKYTTSKKCLKHNVNTKEVNAFSFIDAPGHETLMATMLSGAAIVDGALFVIAANEGIQPQTREHLMALQISGIKNIVIVQNKVDLVDEKTAEKNYNEIKKFVKGTVAENSPIIPISAQHNSNIDLLLETMNKQFKPIDRDLKSAPLFLTLRSFDVNKPGQDVEKLKGGVLGGVLKKGVLKKGVKVSILPGIKVTEGNKTTWQPIETNTSSLLIAGQDTEKIVPGGTVGLMTEIDPYLAKADSLSGAVVTTKGDEPPVWYSINLKIELMERVVGTKSEKTNDPLKTGDSLMINAWTSKTVGIINNVKKDSTSLKLKLPVCIAVGERVAISRLVESRWRLIGWAEVLA